jgi:hypothetical protein
VWIHSSFFVLSTLFLSLFSYDSVSDTLLDLLTLTCNGGAVGMFMFQSYVPHDKSKQKKL